MQGETLIAQNNEKDSLRAVWENSKEEDYNRMNALDDLCWKYYAKYAADSTLVLAEQLYDFAISKGDSTFMTQAIMLKGIYYFNKGDFPLASELFSKSLTLYEILGKESLMVYALNNLAVIYQIQGRYSLSIEYSFKSIELCEKLEDSATIGLNYITIGANYGEQLEYEKSTGYFEKALQINLRLKDTIRIIVAMTNIANNYSILGSFVEAENTLVEAVELSHRIYSLHDEAFIKASLGANCLDWSEKIRMTEPAKAAELLHEALNYYQSSMSLFEGFGAKDGVLQAELGIGETYFALGNNYQLQNNLIKAKEYLLLANNALESTLVDIAELGNPSLHMDAAYATYLSQKALKQERKALASHELYTSLKDSIFDQQEQKKLLRQEYDYAYQKEALKDSLQFANEQAISELKIQNQDATIDRQRFGLGAASIILCLLIVLSTVFFLSRKRIKQDKEKLQVLNREKDGLINIVAHEIQTPLVSTFNFIEMEKLKENNPSQETFLDKCQGQVNRVIYLIRDILDAHRLREVGQSLKEERIELATALESLLEKSQMDAAQKSINFQTIGLKNTFLKTDPSSLVRILENLISNAIKFSPSNKTVKLESSSNKEHVFISVIDEGPGFSSADKSRMFERFQTLSATPTSDENSFGLGLSIVKSLTERIGAKLVLESEQGKGAKFTLQFKLA